MARLLAITVVCPGSFAGFATNENMDSLLVSATFAPQKKLTGNRGFDGYNVFVLLFHLHDETFTGSTFFGA